MSEVYERARRDRKAALLAVHLHDMGVSLDEARGMRYSDWALHAARVGVHAPGTESREIALAVLADLWAGEPNYLALLVR
jgi:hypothetical protein